MKTITLTIIFLVTSLYSFCQSKIELRNNTNKDIYVAIAHTIQMTTDGCLKAGIK